MRIDEAIDELIGREGGYVNHPADRGGPTRFGITEAVARAHGYGGDMRSLPRADAEAIYRRLYWLRPGFDRVAEGAPKVAAELFDTAVNMGPETAVGFLQRALNALNRNGRDYADIAVDRRIGPATLGALAGFLAARRPPARRCWLRRSMRCRASVTSSWRRRGRRTRRSFTGGWRTA